MKNKNRLSITLFIIVGLLSALKIYSQQTEPYPWTDKQLMTAATLYKIINDSSAKKPLLISIGFGGGIKGSVDMGAARDKPNLEKFRKELEKHPKNADIVIYCGCCPYKNCPNVRPAFKLLNEMGFTGHKLLDLPTNLKTDWIDKGYSGK